ncbi:MAG: Gfo/Idh/MocA family oxidoreductase [Phycisphaeraceae bacterium]|nr:Gfo/Idh/MocA family oxidoreductase [Phycisphaeraceae bacterium]
MTVRFGIIGCGDVCEIKSGPAFYKTEHSALTAVMRRDAAGAEDFARRHHVPRWTTDADAILHADDVDIVYIATPPGSHCDYALRAARAGKPCYVEKPMARSAAECRTMVEAFAQARLPLFVAYYRRRLPRFVKIKQLLDDGVIGPLIGLDYHFDMPLTHSDPAGYWRLDATLAGGGLFLDLGSHLLDLLDHLLGPLQDVRGRATNTAAAYDVEDRVEMSFHIAGAPAQAQWNFAAERKRDRLCIRGQTGRIECSCFGNEPVVLMRDDDTEQFDLPNPPHVHQPLVATIVDQLRGKGTCPSTGVSGLRTAEVMDAALSNYYGGRDDAFWNRPDTWLRRT